jgi:hypothetical protein
MLWLYGVAWHQPMAESIAWARTTIAEAIPSASTAHRRLRGGCRAHLGAPATSTFHAAADPGPALDARHPRCRRSGTGSRTLVG